MGKLTKRVVDAAKPQEKPFFVWCSELPGFGVRIFPSKKRVYYVDFYNAAGGRKRMSIGVHGAITTEEARRIAITHLGDVIRGEDPAEERATRRNALTVKELCDRYLGAADKGLIMGKGGRPKKTSTLAIDRGNIAKHIVPLLGKKLVKEVSSADVTRFIRDVAAGKTKTKEGVAKKRGRVNVTGGLGAAARSTELLGGIFTFARSEGVIDRNPVQGVKKPATKKRTRRLSPDEFRALGASLAAADAEGEQWQAVALVRLLALTGLRRGEAVNLKWSEVDIQGRALRLADSKEGASVRPMGSPVVELLVSLPRKETAVYVLPASRQRASDANAKEAPFGGFASSIERLISKAELDGVTAHTLRHSYASTAGDLGFTESTIAALLGHAAGSVTSRYIHHLDTVLIAAADRVARTIDGQMTGETGIVISFPARGSVEN